MLFVNLTIKLHDCSVDGETGFAAVCAEFPEANGQGETRAEAKASLLEAVQLILQDRQDEREVLFESSDREAAAAAVRRHMAHRLVARERQAASLQQPAPPTGYGTASLFLAWLSGLSFGALALLAAALYFGVVKF